MSRDVVFVKYNTSDELRYKYASISVPNIYKCLETLYFVKYTRQMGSIIRIFQFQYQLYINV